jgi:hypothetical protein
MRTTVTLDPDSDAIVRRLMRDRRMTFKQAINAAIRAGVAETPAQPVQYTFPKNMGVPLIDIDKASHFDAELDDEEIIRKLELRK